LINSSSAGSNSLRRLINGVFRSSPGWASEPASVRGSPSRFSTALTAARYFASLVLPFSDLLAFMYLFIPTSVCIAVIWSVSTWGMAPNSASVGAPNTSSAPRAPNRPGPGSA
jgi:hypothetical protein